MRAMMGLNKDRHGTYYARIKVPKRLQEATARVLGNGKDKQVWLKRSLGTKRLSEANVRVKPVLIQFDQTLARAKETLKARPVRTSLSAVEIKRMADYTYAYALAAHDAFIRERTRAFSEVRGHHRSCTGKRWAFLCMTSYPDKQCRRGASYRRAFYVSSAYLVNTPTNRHLRGTLYCEMNAGSFSRSQHDEGNKSLYFSPFQPTTGWRLDRRIGCSA
jgi:hypothetical protein